MTRVPPAPPAGDQYLWDRSGPVDPGVALLERAAEPLRFRPRSLDIARMRVAGRLRRARALAVAAVLALGAVALLLAVPGRQPVAPTPTWTIALAREATIGETRILKAERGSTMYSAETRAGGALVLEADGGTRVEVRERSRLTVFDAEPESPWLELAAGEATVRVGAAARPVGVSVLDEEVRMRAGAVATVAIDGKGWARIAVDAGSAEARAGDVRTRIAPGMTARIEPGGDRVSLPVRAGADPALVSIARKAEDMLRVGETKGAAVALEQVAQRVTRDDAPMLWNLMVRAAPPSRRAVRDVLEKLVTPPPQPAYDGVLTLDPDALEAWWQAAIEAP